MSEIDILTKKILESAKTEFLEKGYDKASMRIIAKKAGLTTGALYTRFPNKDTMFSALVSNTAEQFLKIHKRGKKLDDSAWVVQNIGDDMWARKKQTSLELIDHIYANKTTFSLLVNCSVGSSSYENFIKQIIEIDEQVTLSFLETLKKDGWPIMDVSNQEIHMLVSAQYFALFEIVRHDTPKEDAVKQVNNILDFFICGWNKLFGF